MTKRRIALIGLAAVAVCAARLNAQPAPPDAMPGMGHHHMMGGGPGGPGRFIPLLLHSTDLTPDQDTQVHQILDADRPAVQEIFGQLRQANSDLGSQLLGDPAAQADAVAAQLARIAQLQGQLAQHEVTTVAAIRAVLTPEQLAKALAAKDQMPPWHKGKHQCAGNAVN